MAVAPLFFKVDTPGWRNFRSHKSGRQKGEKSIVVAGSSQPGPADLCYLLGQKDIYIVADLRQEEHGFVLPDKKNRLHLGSRYISFSFTNRENQPNPGIGAGALDQHEKRLMDRIRMHGKLRLADIQWKEDRFLVRQMAFVKVKEVLTEQQSVKNINKYGKRYGYQPLEYYRVPMTDMMPPKPRDVDQIVKIYQKAKQEGKNLLFHCVVGENRTTTALVLTRIMEGKKPEEALDLESNKNPELNGHGSDLREIPKENFFNPPKAIAYAERLGMIYRFYDYWNSEKDPKSFSQYMKEHPIANDEAFLGRMTGLLKVAGA